MGAIIVMLVVAPIPTGYVFASNPANYTVCFFRYPGSFMQYDYYKLGYMVTSILFLTLGFLSRIVRLHRALSSPLATKIRPFLSGCSRRLLTALLRFCNHSRYPKPLRKCLRYYLHYPALATFLTARVTLDMWTSALFEASISHYIGT